MGKCIQTAGTGVEMRHYLFKAFVVNGSNLRHENCVKYSCHGV